MNPSSITQLVDELSCAKATEDFHAALRRVLGEYDQLNQTTVDRTGARLVCKAGCALCCWLRVDVYAHEVFLIADTLRKEWDPAALEEMMGRLKAHAGIVTRLTVLEHATRNIPCPLSRDGWCSVYAVRPHTCRRHHSQNLAACQYTYDHPDDLEAPGAHHKELFRDLTESMGLQAAVYEHLGYDGTVYELGSALEEALSDPDCWRRWSNKEKAFRRASETPSG